MIQSSADNVREILFEYWVFLFKKLFLGIRDTFLCFLDDFLFPELDP